LLLSCLGIFHNIYDGIDEELKCQVLTAIIKELAAILKVNVEVILAPSKSLSSSEMVRIAMAAFIPTW